ncbi:hypothetical protein D3C87_1583290 [compost metagenome]
MGQHFIDPAARFDGARNWQMAVFFQQQCAVNRRRKFLRQSALHGRNSHHIGLDNAVLGGSFRERFRQVRRKTRQASVGILHIRLRQPDVRQPFGKRGGARVKPGGLFQRHQILYQRKLGG